MKEIIDKLKKKLNKNKIYLDFFFSRSDLEKFSYHQMMPNHGCELFDDKVDILIEAQDIKQILDSADYSMALELLSDADSTKTS